MCTSHVDELIDAFNGIHSTKLTFSPKSKSYENCHYYLSKWCLVENLEPATEVIIILNRIKSVITYLSD